MPLAPPSIPSVAQAIVRALPDEIEKLVAAATGNELFIEYASPKTPLRRAVEDALRQLVVDRKERWLLTHIMIHEMAGPSLLRLIVKDCPEALLPPPNVDQQVARVMRQLVLVTAAVSAAAAADPWLKDQLHQSRDKFGDISRQISALAAYKGLHECLHALDLKLTFLAVLDRNTAEAGTGALDGRPAQLQNACLEARARAAPLGSNSAESQLEFAWIDELEKLVGQYGTALGARDAAAAASLMSDVQRLVRLQLSRLNARIFETACKLPLANLVLALRDEFSSNDFFDEFDFAVRDLSPTVIARALYHRMWQDADNELAMMTDLLDAPYDGLKLVLGHWVTFWNRITWLIKYDPDIQWAAEALKGGEHLADALADLAGEVTEGKINATTRQSFEDYFNQIRLRFLAIDAALKSDFGILSRIDPSLQSFLAGIK